MPALTPIKPSFISPL